MAAKRLMGFVPQEIALYPELSARQNLLFFGRMYALRGKALKQRVDELLESRGTCPTGRTIVSTPSPAA